MVLALWYRVPVTLYLEEMVWWLSYFRYKSVWDGFLNTDVLRLFPSSFCIIVNVSSTNLFHNDGGVGDVLMVWTSRSSMNRFATIGLIGDPMAAPSVCW